MSENPKIDLSTLSTADAVTGITACDSMSPYYIATVREGIEAGDLKEVHPAAAINALAKVAMSPVDERSTKLSGEIFKFALSGALKPEALRYGQELLSSAGYVAFCVIDDPENRFDSEDKATWIISAARALATGKFVSPDIAYVVTDTILGNAEPYPDGYGLPHARKARVVLGMLAAGKLEIDHLGDAVAPIMQRVTAVCMRWIASDSSALRGDIIRSVKEGIACGRFTVAQVQILNRMIGFCGE
ncbi:hypothetical protein JW710_01710 [Candidatus Dojkabacteria bacterium]|nr:hypothetical protein [Candidatus Dojkabacteria bacterium]